MIIKLWILRHTTSMTNHIDIIIIETTVFPHHNTETSLLFSCNCYHSIFHQNCSRFHWEVIVYLKTVLSLQTTKPYNKNSNNTIYFSCCNQFFWLIIFNVISNTDYSITPPYLYLWVDIGIIIFLYSLVFILPRFRN